MRLPTEIPAGSAAGVIVSDTAGVEDGADFSSLSSSGITSFLM